MNFSRKLVNWYLENKRELPWRNTKNPYKIWLSEIMLQQTRIAQGLSYYKAFTEEFLTVFNLAEAKEQKVLKMWQGLGYYSRARNLHFTAKYIAKELDGVFPNNYKDLLKLKGVGDYTASAIASICFNEPNAVVDGNVYRVLARYFGIKTAINSTEGKKRFKELAQTLIDVKQPGIYNQAIMDFGATLCKPQNPLCSQCPISSSCVALEKKLIKLLPVKQKKLSIKNRYFNYLVLITENKKTILEQRKSKGIWQGLYQFPLIESNQPIDEKQLMTLKYFINLFLKETTVSLFNQEDIIHKLSHQHLHTKFWIVKTASHPQAKIRWKEIKEYPVPVLIEKLIEKLQKNI